MLSLIAAPFRVLHWMLYAVLRIVGDKRFYFAAGLAGVGMVSLGRWTDADFFRFLLYLAATSVCVGMYGYVFRPGARRQRMRAIPVPVVAVIAKPVDRPTARMAMARLDPVLRRIIQTQPAAEG